MALLIVLSIIGGATALAGLYVLGANVSQYLVAETKMFKENVQNIIEKRREKKARKADAKKEAEEIKNETAKNEITVEVSDVIEEIKE